jgi:polysaccharide biosynthesis transport protein
MSASGPETPASPTLGERFDFVVGFLRRRYLVIAVSLLLSLALGASYLFTVPPTYTASAIMIIETRKGPSVLPDSFGGMAPDAAWVETQIGVLKSLNVLNYVVKQLRLADDPQFIRGNTWPLVDKVLDRLGWAAPEPKTEAERVGAAIAVVSDGLEVKRVGQSYMMRIDFRSQNSEQAVRVANAMIDGYISDQLNAKYQANRRAGDWLQERLQALREQAAAAERSVIEFKSKNNIVTAAGTLMNDKRLAEMSAQLATARANTTDVQIRLERIEAVRQAYQQDKPGSAADENISEAMSSGIINKLRDRYLDLVNREADWSVRYGKNHTAVVNLRNQIRDMRRSIFDELGRIEEQFKSEYEIAKRRQNELEKGLATQVSQSTETNQAQIALFSLEAAAQSYRKIYDSFLQRHTESVQQQSFPISDARAISSATASQTAPRPLRVWLVAIFAGGMLGTGLGALREMRDRGFRTREQVRSVLATECLALVPLIADRNKFFSGRRSLALPPAGRAQLGARTETGARNIYSAQKVMRTIVDTPSSLYAEAVRSIKLSVDLNSQANNKIIGLTSCLPSEGKSSLAAAMAALIAQGGARVILVDCDVRNPSLSRALAPDASAGFLDVVAGKLDLADAIWTDPATGMSFLPAGPIVPHATEILASEDAKVLFSTLQVRYDYVIVDLAPLVAGVDVRASTRFVDSYVLVIEWGATTVDAVQYALRHAPGVQANIVGAVLNKVNVPAMSRYDRYGVNYYHDKVRYPRGMN